MIKQVVTYLNLKLESLGYFNDVLCLAEKIEREGAAYPALYTNGEYVNIELDPSGSVSYWRKTGDVSLSDEVSNQTGCSVDYKIGIPLKLVGFLPKDSPYNDQYFSDNVIAEIIGQLTSNNAALKKSIKAKSVRISAKKYTTNPSEVAKDEFDKIDFEARYSHAYFSIEFNVEILANQNCYNSFCQQEAFHCPTLLENIDDATVQQVIDAISLSGRTDEFESGICGPVIITNSAGTVLATTGVDVTISDVTHTDSDGSSVVKADHVAMVCTPGTSLYPIVYAWPSPTGATVSYQTRDDYWVKTNYFNATTTTGRLTAIADFFTLRDLNVFGNTNRFTDTLGAQLYGSGNAALVGYVIDHYTGLGWSITSFSTAATTWTLAVTASVAATYNGFSDWFIPNVMQYESINNKSACFTPSFSNLLYSPFNLINSTSIYSSTSLISNSGFKFVMDNAGQVIFTFGTASYKTILCRKHF